MRTRVVGLLFCAGALGGCQGGLSEAGGDDAGLPDSGAAVDAGPVDAGERADAGAPDAGGNDAGSGTDAGVADAGALDAGHADAGALDAGGASDAGDPDAGHADAGGLPDAGEPTDAGVVHLVTVDGFAFTPASVTIQAGETVRWVFAAAFHNVVSGGSCTADDRFCSPRNSGCSAAPLADVNDVYDVTFTDAGTYPYFCSMHCVMGMTGTVIVQ